MKLSLPDSVSSIQDLRSLTAEVRQYAKAYSHAAIKQQLGVPAADQPAPVAVSPACAELLNGWAGTTKAAQNSPATITAAKLDELIACLTELETTAPAITITLAAPAAGSLKQALVAWCRANIEANILVSFQFNSTILGGMVVRYGSRVYDWSFRRQILAGRDKFPEVLRSV